MYVLGFVGTSIFFLFSFTHSHHAAMTTLTPWTYSAHSKSMLTRRTPPSPRERPLCSCLYCYLHQLQQCHPCLDVATVTTSDAILSSLNLRCRFLIGHTICTTIFAIKTIVLSPLVVLLLGHRYTSLLLLFLLIFLTL